MGCCFLKPQIPLIGTNSSDSSTNHGIPYYQLKENDVSEQETPIPIEIVPENNTNINTSLKEAKITIQAHPIRAEERKLRRAFEISVNRKASSDELPPQSVRKQFIAKQVKTALTLPVNPRRSGKSNTLPASFSEQLYVIPLLDQIKPKWQRDANELPVAADLPRMVQNVMVRCGEDEVLFERASTKNNTNDSDSNNSNNTRSRLTLLKNLFLTLAHRFTLRDLHSNILLRWSDFFGDDEVETVDITQQLRKFLFQVVGNQNALINVLKGVNQSVISPAVMRIRSFFIGVYDLKDVRNAWDVDILFTREGIIVRHLKWEESIPSCFKFQWKLDLIFNENATELMDIRLDVPILQFVDNIQNSEEQKVREIIVDIINVSPQAPRPN